MHARTLTGMNSGDLTMEQIEALRQKLLPMMAWVKSLETRIEQQKFPPLDPLRLRTLCLYDQLQAMEQILDKLSRERTIKDTYLMGCRSQREFKRAQRERR